jgi:hypothetical protein
MNQNLTLNPATDPLHKHSFRLMFFMNREGTGLKQKPFASCECGKVLGKETIEAVLNKVYEIQRQKELSEKG